MTQTHAVILFYTSSHAMRAEKVLQRAGIPNKLMPVPRHLSSDCGVCMRIDAAQVDAVRRLLAEQRVEFVDIHPV